MSIIDLHKKDFIGSFLKTYKDEPVIILVKASWCGHCTKFKQTYIDFAKQTKIKCAQIDADIDKDLLKEIASFTFGPKVQGFPTILFYNNGYYIRTLQTDRTVQNLNQFISSY